MFFSGVVGFLVVAVSCEILRTLEYHTSKYHTCFGVVGFLLAAASYVVAVCDLFLAELLASAATAKPSTLWHFWRFWRIFCVWE